MFVSQEGRPSNFDIVNPLSKSKGAETEDLNLIFGGAGSVSSASSRCRWHGAKSCIGPAEMLPNVFGKKHESKLLD